MRLLSRSAAADRSEIRTALLLFGAVLVLLLTWVVGMPRYSQPDEFAHMIKTYATSHGQGAGSPIAGEPALLRTMTVPATLVSGNPGCFVFHPDVSAGCAVPNSDMSPLRTETWVASYPPWYYAVVGIPARVLGQDTSVLTTRAISALVCAALLAGALAIFRKCRGERAALALVVLTPMTLSISGAVNPSALEICGAFLFWSLLTSIAADQGPPNRRTRTWAGVVAASVVLVRPVALPWMLAGFVAVMVIEWRRLAEPRKQMRSWTPAMLVVTAAAVASWLWGLYADTPLSDSRFRVESSVGSMLRLSLGRTVELGRGAFGVLGWLDTELPSPALLLWITSVTLLAIVVWLGGGSRERAVLLGLALLWVVFPVAYTAAVSTPENWQGRYSLPLLGGLAFTALLVRADALGGTAVRRISRFVALVFPVIEVASFHQALRRFMVGASGSFTLRHPGWHPPLNAWLLVLANAAAAAVLVAVMLRRSLQAAVAVDPGMPTRETVNTVR